MLLPNYTNLSIGIILLFSASNLALSQQNENQVDLLTSNKNSIQEPEQKITGAFGIELGVHIDAIELSNVEKDEVGNLDPVRKSSLFDEYFIHVNPFNNKVMYIEGHRQLLDDKAGNPQSCWIEFMALKWILDSKYGALRLLSAVDDKFYTNDGVVQYYRTDERTIELKCYPGKFFSISYIDVVTRQELEESIVEDYVRSLGLDIKEHADLF